jgi:hypothetical protein
MVNLAQMETFFIPRRRAGGAGGMQKYSFTVRNGGLQQPDTTSLLPNAVTAQKLALAMCADLSRDIVTHLTDTTGWQVTVSDETGRPIYRLSVVAESLE